MTSIEPSKIVDISIDFDFFVRELPEWDYGHVESDLFIGQAWSGRYLWVDLWNECNPFQHADTTPDVMLEKLISMGLSMYRQRSFGYAESHSWALPFLLQKSQRRPADLLINFDAHHDCYTDFRSDEVNAGKRKPSCENWVQHYMDLRPLTEVLWVPPKWKEDEELGTPFSSENGRQILTRRFSDLQFNGARVRNVFICRSGAWVPPHLDPLFSQLGHFFSERVKKIELLGPTLRDRSSYAPTIEEAKKQLEQRQEMLKFLEEQTGKWSSQNKGV